MRWLLLSLVLMLLVGCIKPPEITGAVLAVDSLVERNESIIEEYEAPKQVIVTGSATVSTKKYIEPTDYQINVTRNGFSPNELTIARGSSVSFINYDRAPKQITSSWFTSPILRSLQTYEHTFEENGVFGYSDSEHVDVWGKIIVVEPVIQNYTRLVKVTPFAYRPQKVEITVGETVRWRNEDTSSRTVSGAGFDSGTLRAGEEFDHTFTRIGTFPYGDSYHQNLIGTVVVKSKT